VNIWGTEALPKVTARKKMSMTSRIHKKRIARSTKLTSDAYRNDPIKFGPRGGSDNESLTQNRANGPNSDTGIGILPISVLT
jgi:hypothetical protein